MSWDRENKGRTSCLDCDNPDTQDETCASCGRPLCAGCSAETGRCEECDEAIGISR